MSLKRFGLRAVLSALILAWVMRTSDVTAVLSTMRGADTRFLLLGVALYLAGDLLSAGKLQLLLRVQNARFWPVWRHYYVGKLFNSFLPTTIGGDAVKARRLERHFDDFNAYSAVFMERFTGLVALLAIAVVATAFYARSIPASVHLVVYTGFLPAVLLASALLWSSRLSGRVSSAIRSMPGADLFGLGDKLAAFHATVREYESSRRTVGVALGLSLAFHVLLVGVNVVFAHAVGMTVDPVYFFVFVPVSAILLLLPISIGGFGVREAIYVFFFTQVGATAGEAVSLALVLNGTLVLSAGVGAMVYLSE